METITEIYRDFALHFGSKIIEACKNKSWNNSTKFTGFKILSVPNFSGNVHVIDVPTLEVLSVSQIKTDLQKGYFEGMVQVIGDSAPLPTNGSKMMRRFINDTLVSMGSYINIFFGSTGRGNDFEFGVNEAVANKRPHLSPKYYGNLTERQVILMAEGKITCVPCKTYFLVVNSFDTAFQATPADFGSDIKLSDCAITDAVVSMGGPQSILQSLNMIQYGTKRFHVQCIKNMRHEKDQHYLSASELLIMAKLSMVWKMDPGNAEKWFGELIETHPLFPKASTAVDAESKGVIISRLQNIWLKTYKLIENIEINATL